MGGAQPSATALRRELFERSRLRGTAAPVRPFISVPRFFFESEDDGFSEDVDGLELDSLWTAQVEATRLLGQMLKDDPELMLRPGGLSVVVRDEYGLTTKFVASIVT
jgi:hypothetical protein